MKRLITFPKDLIRIAVINISCLSWWTLASATLLIADAATLLIARVVTHARALICKLADIISPAVSSTAPIVKGYFAIRTLADAS